jgi:hypothetical protein
MTKNAFGYLLCDFFSNSSGHPGHCQYYNSQGCWPFMTGFIFESFVPIFVRIQIWKDGLGFANDKSWSEDIFAKVEKFPIEGEREENGSISRCRVDLITGKKLLIRIGFSPENSVQSRMMDEHWDYCNKECLLQPENYIWIIIVKVRKLSVYRQLTKVPWMLHILYLYVIPIFKEVLWSLQY